MRNKIAGKDCTCTGPRRDIFWGGGWFLAPSNNAHIPVTPTNSGGTGLSQSVLYYVTQCFLERTIEYWHKERLRIRLFLFTHCRVALSAVSKGVGGSRESIVCEILHCIYQDPLPSPLQCACPQLLLGFNIAFTTCASPIKHLVPPPLPAQQRIKLYSLCF